MTTRKEAYDLLFQAQKDYERYMALADEALAKAKEVRAAIAMLNAELSPPSISASEVRRNVIGTVSCMKDRQWSVAEIQDALPRYDKEVVSKAVHYLKDQGILVWNEQKGVASKYVLVA